jgi:hypothetical protein
MYRVSPYWGPPQKVTSILISASWSCFKLEFNRLHLRKNKRVINNIFIFAFLQEVHEMASMFADTPVSSAWTRNSQTFEDSRHILYFTSKLLNSVPQFQSSIKCTGIDLGFQISPQKKNFEDSSQVSITPGNWSFLPTASPVQVNFWPATDALPSFEAPLCWNHMWRLVLKDITSSKPLKCIQRQLRYLQLLTYTSKV